ncbi:class I SAM-dependent methyltransferase [Actinophytocola sp.]|uniref:class I SAM-dependent methyltransferase n=1 Tax=Actinophytocola sp. TaxID=1872138 RepID=UPI003D6A09A1
MTTSSSTYLLGHDEQELARLEHQARILAPATRTILGLAGVAPGMRVLDLGTGAGDVAFEVAALVGPTGSVVGVDQSVRALRFAAVRAEQRGLTNVSFIHDDLHTVRIEDEFDAVVGRLILLYTPDPAAILRRLVRFVRPGGIVVMMEYEMHAAGTLPRTELCTRVIGWITEAFDRSGLDASLGARLGPILRDASFDEHTVIGLQAYHEPGDPAGPKLAAETVRTLLPVIERTGVATAGEVDIDTLEDRVARDGARHGVTFKPPVLVGAWAVAGQEAGR